MLEFLQNPHAFGLCIVVLTAALVYAYQYTVEPDPEANKRTAYKICAAGLVSTLALVWLVYRPTEVLTEPFNADTPTAA